MKKNKVLIFTLILFMMIGYFKVDIFAKNLLSEEVKILDDGTKLYKIAKPVGGKVNTWDITLKVESEQVKESVDVVLVLDASNSMWKTENFIDVSKQRAIPAREAAIEFVNKTLENDENTRIAIVSYDSYVHYNLNFSREKSKLIESIEEIYPNDTYKYSSGATHTQAGIYKARELLKNSVAKNKNIVLLSDGEPTYSYYINYLAHSDFLEIKENIYETKDDMNNSKYNYNHTIGNGSETIYNPFGWGRYVYDGIGNYNYYYINHGNSAIAESRFAKNENIDIYSIGLYMNKYGSNILNKISSGDGYFYDGRENDLSPAFEKISGKILSPIKSINIVDKMGTGFKVVGGDKLKKENEGITLSDDSKELIWNFEKLSKVGSANKIYEELTYRVEIDDNILNIANTDGPYPANEIATIKYKNYEDKEIKNEFLVPMVYPTLVKVKKELFNPNGEEKEVDENIENKKTFDIQITGPDYDEIIKLKSWEELTITDIKTPGEYTVKEIGATGGLYNYKDEINIDKFTILETKDKKVDLVDIVVKNTEKEAELKVNKLAYVNNKLVIEDMKVPLGTEIKYIIKIENIGNLDFKDIEIEDKMPEKLENVELIIPEELKINIKYNEENKTISGTLNIKEGETIEITIKGKIPREGVSSKTSFKNTAIITDPENKYKPKEPETPDITVEETPSLVASKKAYRYEGEKETLIEKEIKLPLGTKIKYAIEIRNTGNLDLKDIKIEDEIPKELNIIQVDIPEDIKEVKYNEENKRISGTLDIKEGETITIYIVGEIPTEGVSSTANFKNKVVIDNPENKYKPKEPETPDIMVEETPSLDASKKAYIYEDEREIEIKEATKLNLGTKIKYVIKIRNTGNLDLKDIKIEDEIPKELNIIQVDIPEHIKEVKYNEENKRISGTLDIKEGETITIYIVGEIPTEGVSSTANFKNKVVIDNPENKYKPKEPETPDITVEETPEKLEIIKIVDKATAKVEETLTYTITIKNIGDATLKNVSVEDNVPAELTDVKVTGYGGITAVGNKVSGTITELKVGAPVTLTVTGKIKTETTAGTKIENTVAGTPENSDKPGEPVKPKEPAITEVTEEPEELGKLEIEKTVDKDKAKAGEELTYTIKIKHTGDKIVRGIKVEDEMPKELENLKTDNKNISFDGNRATLELIEMKDNEEIVFKITGTIKLDTKTGTEIKNTAIVNLENPDIDNPENPEDTAITEVVEKGVLIRKIDSKTKEYLEGAVFNIYKVVENNSNEIFSNIEKLQSELLELEKKLQESKENVLVKNEEDNLEKEIDEKLLGKDEELNLIKRIEDIEREIKENLLTKEENVEKLIKDNIITDETGTIMLENLEVGKYIIIETVAPLGYILENNKIEFEVKDFELTIVEIENTEIETPLLPLEPEPVVPKKPTIPELVEPINPMEDEPVIEPKKTVELIEPELNKDDHFAYMIGYPEGDFRPNSKITRAEVTTIFFRMLTDNSRNDLWSSVNNFGDVEKSAWYNNAISTMSNGKVVEGYKGDFRPNEKMTRAEFITLASRFFTYSGEGNHNFKDMNGHWSEKHIGKVFAKGWINGYEDGTFRPDQAITRAEAAKLVNAILERKPEKTKLLDEMISWVDNSEESKWYYEDIQEATNSHKYQRENIKEKELWTEILPVRDWAKLESEWSNANSSFNPGEIVK